MIVRTCNTMRTEKEHFNNFTCQHLKRKIRGHVYFLAEINSKGFENLVDNGKC